ncbi:MAG: hypothetical protein GEV08_06240 [Acidimicrobiia bacterium]|nr:hypothetical protein [Acidimicrobiia bacterium]
MRRIPVATDRMTFLGVTVTQAETFDEATRTRSPKVTADGEYVWKVQCLVIVEGEKGELVEVNLRGARPEVDAMAPVEFEGLVAQPWNMAGNAGVSFAADAMVKPGAKNGRSAPSAPAGSDAS